MIYLAIALAALALAGLGMWVMHADYRRTRRRTLQGNRRKCHWCEFTGKPVDVLFHEISEHGA